MDWYPSNGVKHLVDQPVGVVHRALDGTFARENTGWEAKTSLEEGIRETIEWYVTNHCTEEVKKQLSHKLMQR